MGQKMNPAVYITAGVIIFAVELFAVVANIYAGVYDMRLVTGFVLMAVGILLIVVGIKNIRSGKKKR